MKYKSIIFEKTKEIILNYCYLDNFSFDVISVTAEHFCFAAKWNFKTFSFSSTSSGQPYSLIFFFFAYAICIEPRLYICAWMKAFGQKKYCNF